MPTLITRGAASAMAYGFGASNVMKQIIYVSMGNSTLVTVTPTGTVVNPWVSLVSGDNAQRLFLDSTYNIYACATGHNSIAKITPMGVLTDPWASISNGSTIARDSSGNFYSNDFSGDIYKISPSGSVNPSWAVVSSYPLVMTIDASNNIYTVNSDNNISKITSAGSVTNNWSSVPLAPKGGINVDSLGNIYIAYGYREILKITPAGVASSFGSCSGYGYTILIDSTNTLYVASVTGSDIAYIDKITSSGSSTLGWASGFSSYFSSQSQAAMTFGKDGNIYTCDAVGNITKVNSSGVVTVLASLGSEANTVAVNF